ncbi:unnamed protein product [Pleuronectes platessa]|uniref:Uncharacterized protein n=1 Tax=Pleuronectes platessa TaxID=8262 RepID=A0A9N7U400_PLEPL|nr:unnamed protein product [Pleuronectes platessa]
MSIPRSPNSHQLDNPLSARSDRSPPAEPDDREQPSQGTRPGACHRGAPGLGCAAAASLRLDVHLGNKRRGLHSPLRAHSGRRLLCSAKSHKKAERRKTEAEPVAGKQSGYHHEAKETLSDNCQGFPQVGKVLPGNQGAASSGCGV